MPRRRALIAIFVALLLLGIGLALALSGVTVPAGKDDARPIEFAGTDRAAEAAAGPSPQAPGEPAIPADYRGEWNADLAACGTGDDESRLRIEPRALRFYESEGQVLSVRSDAPRTITVTLEMRGEGEQWRETRALALSPDGDLLTIGDLTRRRCR